MFFHSKFILSAEIVASVSPQRDGDGLHLKALKIQSVERGRRARKSMKLQMQVPSQFLAQLAQFNLMIWWFDGHGDFTIQLRQKVGKPNMEPGWPSRNKDRGDLSTNFEELHKKQTSYLNQLYVYQKKQLKWWSSKNYDGDNRLKWDKLTSWFHISNRFAIFHEIRVFMKFMMFLMVIDLQHIPNMAF